MVEGGWLDYIILEVVSNLNDSVILWGGGKEELQVAMKLKNTAVPDL